MRPTLRSTVALVCLIPLTACSVATGSGAAAPPVLDGTTWTLAMSASGPSAPGVTSSLSFAAGGRIAGSDGCNRYAGTYRTGGDTLALAPGPSTMMACAEPAMTQARVFLAALATTRRYTIEQGRLVLRDGGDTMLAELDAIQPAVLPGTRWVATGVNNGKHAVVSHAGGAEITAEFGAASALAGSAGCNRYTTRYTLDGGRIAILPPAVTRRACPAEVMEREREYLAALARVATYRLDADRLEFRSADGALQATFRRQP